LSAGLTNLVVAFAAIGNFNGNLVQQLGLPHLDVQFGKPKYPS